MSDLMTLVDAMPPDAFLALVVMMYVAMEAFT